MLFLFFHVYKFFFNYKRGDEIKNILENHCAKSSKNKWKTSKINKIDLILTFNQNIYFY